MKFKMVIPMTKNENTTLLKYEFLDNGSIVFEYETDEPLLMKELSEAIWKPVIIDVSVSNRYPECIKNWPECEDGKYDPRCCRFPKSCSCDIIEPS